MYSRPATRQVDAMARVPTPMSIDVGSAQRVRRSANGPLLDNRSGDQLYRNGMARAAEVTNFIEGLTKVATPIIKDQLTQQANRQVGELLSQYQGSDLVRVATDEQSALIRQLSPQARDIVNARAAEAGVYEYAAIHSAERTRLSSVLTSTTASEKDVLNAEAEARSIALEKSGLKNLPPEYLAAQAGTLAEIDGKLRGADYSARLKEQDSIDEVKLGNEFNTENSRLAAEAIAFGRDGKGREWLVGTVEYKQRQIKRNADAQFKPLRQAEIEANALGAEIQKLVGLGTTESIEEALGLVRMHQSLAQQGVMTPAGINYYDQLFQDKSSFRSKLNGLEQALVKEQEKVELKQFMQAGMEGLRLLAQGDTAGGQELVNAAIAQAKTPEQLLPYISAAGAMENYGTRLTDTDRNNQLDFQLEIEKERRSGNAPSPEEILQRGRDRGLKPSQLLGLSGWMMQQDEGSNFVGQVAQTEQLYRDELEQAVATVESKTGKKAEKLMVDARVRAARETAQILEVRAKNGMTTSPDERAAIYQTALQGWVDQELSKVGQTGGKPEAIVRQQVYETENNLRQNNGQWDLKVFPASLVENWKQLNKGKEPSVSDLQKLLIRRMGAKDSTGKPIYLNAERELREMGQRTNSTDSLKRIQGVRSDSPSPRGSTESQKRIQGVRSDDRSLQSSNPVTGLLGATLGSIARVLTPPAAAATLDSVVVNQGAVDTLSKLWKKQEGLKPSTPPLPQVAASSPVGFVPTAITSDKHPIFVAIGIAEGTRTPNGGYTRAYYGHTDPGDKNWNRGTVSGGRGTNATPAQVDRQWMRTSTQLANQVAPILRRAGLQPGTQGWNRVMFNVLDLNVQSPEAATDQGGFVSRIPQIVRQGATIEVIAKARADSYYNPRTGRLEAGGFQNNYSRLFQDQRSRAGVWDYRRRI